MLDTKYAVKYKMPHSLLHIVDNSANADAIANTVADDPSLFSTIVVTATPMGVDNRIVNLTRADVASVSFGLGSITTEDIEKYGQTITYPMSLIENGNAPVKLIRITPDGSTYAYAIILVQWCFKPITNDANDMEMHVRFVPGQLPDTLRPDKFKNTDKLNAAIVAGTQQTFTDEDGTVWEQRVFINAIAAGRGKVYNDMAFAINFPQQGRRQPNCRYKFATINTATGLVVETFYASLSNATTSSIYSNTIEDVNTVVGKRVEGSSILVPYLNNKAVREVWDVYYANVMKLKSTGALNDTEITEIKTTDINTFDMVYGNYIYDGGEQGLKLPAYYIDMLDIDIARLETEDQFKVVVPDDKFDVYNPNVIYENLYPITYGVEETGDAVYVGDTYLYSDSGTYLEPGITVVAGINQYSGAVTTMTYYKVNVPALGPGEETKSRTLAAWIPDVNLTDEELSDATDDAYVLLSSQPDDWTTGYASYYTNASGTSTGYAAVEAATDPEFTSGVYYAKTGEETYQQLTSRPSDWETNYASYYTRSGEEGAYVYTPVAAADPHAPTFKQATYYKKVEHGLVTARFNENKTLARLIKNGVLPEKQTLAIAYTITRNGVQTFDVASIYIENNAVTKAELNPILFDVLSAIDFQSRNGGNIIATSRKNTLANVDGAYSRVGMTYIALGGTDVYGPDTGTSEPATARTVATSEVYVNGYMIKTAQTPVSQTFEDETTHETTTRIVYPDVRKGRVLVTNNTNKFGICPSTINVPSSLLGHNYDVIRYEADTYNKAAVVEATTAVKNFISDVETMNGSKFSGGKPAPEAPNANVGDIIAYPGVINETGTDASGLKFKVTAVDPTDGVPTAIEFIGGSITYDSENTFDDISGGVMKRVKTYDETTYTDTGSYGSINLMMADMRVKEILSKVVDNTDQTIKQIIPASINRYMVTGTTGTLNRLQPENMSIPRNYYDANYGNNPSSAAGGFALDGGSTGFFDQNISDIEFKWRYSELLVKAYRGQIDPRIMSPTRCAAKFLFDGGTNTIVGQTILPNVVYRPIDIMTSSTIFTEDEKDAAMYDEDILNDFIDTYDSTADIDVKQAMYDLMVYRCYYGMPEDKRPLGPGYGLSLHLDSGVTDAQTALLINDSFKRRFTNPNASWDIGGYVSSENGVAYTYTKWTVDNMIKHCKATSINKPFVMSYATIPVDQYTSFFPDIDTTDWELRELLYNSGGNAWIPDINGNLVRRSQRTLQTTSDTSDLVQESNMRTLSQLCYILQNKIDSFLLEYDDDGSLKTLSEQVNNLFINWPGFLVDTLSITFERDKNPLDGGDIVVCYCNVTFRGLILRVPIIVNVQRRNG